jgi:hypothetical protein
VLHRVNRLTVIFIFNVNKILNHIGVQWEQKRDEIAGVWRKLYIEELHNLYSSPSIIRRTKSRRMKWAGHVPRMGAKRNAYRVLVGKPEGKRLLGRHSHRWGNNIKMNLI